MLLEKSATSTLEKGRYLAVTQRHRRKHIPLTRQICRPRSTLSSFARKEGPEQFPVLYEFPVSADVSELRTTRTNVTAEGRLSLQQSRPKPRAPVQSSKRALNKDAR